ncbi:MAG: transposase [Dactylosporangium sp.]|nr:transposase [Dactylosporangium sp.]
MDRTSRGDHFRSTRTGQIQKTSAILVCDGSTGLPDAVNQVWPEAIVQTCIVHLLRNSYKYASKRDWAAIARDLKPVYTAPSDQAALDRFADFSATWEKKYPAIIGLWKRSWAEMVPFLKLNVEIRRIICTTNAIESMNARFRRAVNALRPLPQRSSRPEDPRFDGHESRPDRQGPGPVDQPVEACAQRSRYCLRRTCISRTTLKLPYISTRKNFYTTYLTHPLPICRM